MAVIRRRSTIPQAPRYTHADVDALSRAQSEPNWLRERRFDAWERYLQAPMPYMEEEWRRTDYRNIRWDEADRLIPANGATASAVPSKNLEPLTGDEQGGLLVFVDGEVVRFELSDSLAQKGVIFTDLRSAIRDHEDLVKANLMTRAVTPADGKFAAMHGALWNYGVFVYVPRGVIAELPLHVVCYHTAAGAALGHVLVVLDDNAQATMQVEYASRVSDLQSAYIGATELIVGAASNLRYVSLQDWNRETFEFSHQRGVVGRDAQLDWVNGVMGGRLTKAFIEVDAVGTGANARVSGFFLRRSRSILRPGYAAEPQRAIDQY